MLLATKEDRALHVMQCVKNAATRLGLVDVDWKSSDELLEDLEKLDSTTYTVLVEYLNAYRAWHDYQSFIEKNGMADRLNDLETATLHQRRVARDENRKAIVLRLDTVAPRR